MKQMKQIKVFFIFSVFIIASIVSSYAQADLLGRLKIEEVLKERIEQALKINDKTAKATVRIEYDKYDTMGEDLPGMNHTVNKSFYTEKLEDSDIKKISVQYFSETKELALEQSALIYSLIPVARNKISVSFKNLSPTPEGPTPVQVKDLNEIADKSVYMLSLMLGVSLAGACLIFGFALFFNNSKNRSLFKEQFGSLISSLSNGIMGHSSGPQALEIQSKPNTNTDSGFGAGGKAVNKLIFADYSNQALAALFSDLYWCEKDGVAHYLWNNITTQQKEFLLKDLNYLYAYSIHFSNVPATANEIVFHPYYNQPLDLNQTSQESLLILVKKNFSLWSKISPLRQQSLPLSLKEKIKANSAIAVTLTDEIFPESKPRVLPRPVTFGDISFEDEIEIFNDPSLIPQELRKHIPSLVWLAQKDKNFIEQKFEKLDAKFLAAAWFAAPDILAQLEQCIPEKKLLLLKSYINSVPPSKSSSAFQFLFKLGLEVSDQNYESIQKAS